MSKDKPIDRRRFFREGLRELLKPLAGATEPLEHAMRQLGALEGAAHRAASGSPSIDAWLRPPGAIDERAFTETCSRCGTCVKVCPAQCIKIDPTGIKGGGAPYIDPDEMPCVVCDGLVCMRDCPSGAIIPTALGLLDMGTAVWNEQACTRSTGENCTICIDRCPIGSVAIELRDGRVHVIDDGCIGCGVCQHDCPTTPKSIMVIAGKKG